MVQELKELECVPERKIPRVVVAAYACEPHLGSEPGVAWNLIVEASRFAELWVLVCTRHRPGIEAALPNMTQSFRDRVTWIFIDPPRWLWWVKRNVPIVGTHIHYRAWQWVALRAARRLHGNIHFDLAHHLTYGVAWSAPVLSLLPMPFVWGPMGGGDSIPKRFLMQEGWNRCLQEWIYWLLNNVVIRVSPLAIIARRKAKAIIFRVSATERRFPASPAARRIIMSETAVGAIPKINHQYRDSSIRIVCVGRMIYGKGLTYAVKGFHRFLEQGGIGELVLLGDGPQYRLISQYCNVHRIGSHVHLRGRVPSEEVQQVLGQSDVFLHPSFREGGSWSILEAMSNGLPVICLNRSGMADMVDESCGIKLNVASPDELIEGIASALHTLAREPSLRRRLGMAGQCRVSDYYTWQQRGEQLERIYSQLLFTKS